jgi:hypothetical protein
MPQTVVQNTPPVAFAGDHAYPELPRSEHSYICDETNGLPAGIFVTRSAEDAVKLPAASTDVTATGVGFVHRDPTWGGTGGTQTVMYAKGDVIAVMRKGYIWCLTEGAVTQEGAVFARFTASGGNTQLGKVRADADTATAAQVPNARFVTSTTGAGLAIVEVW